MLARFRRARPRTWLVPVLTSAVAASVLLGVGVPSAQAAGTARWSNRFGEWSNPASWVNGVLPGEGDDVVFSDGSSVLVRNDVTAGPTYGSLTIAGFNYSIIGNDIKLAGSIRVEGGFTHSLSTGFERDDTPVVVPADTDLGMYGPISGPGGVALTGGGTLTLGSAANTYVSPTVVGSGTLLVNGTVPSSIVLSGGTVGGQGVLAGPGMTSTAPSTINPGPSFAGAATLTYTNAADLALPSDTTLHLDIDSETSFDRLALTSGSAGFDPNGATLDISMGYVPTVGTTFDIVTQTSDSAITGRFARLAQSGTFTAGATTFSVGYSSSGITLTVTSVSIPTATWDGGSTPSTPLWSARRNWVDDVAPLQGSHLLFPAGVTQQLANNSLSGVRRYASLTVADSGYTILSSPGRGLTTSSLRGLFGSGTSTIRGGLDLSSATAEVQAGGTLELAGPLTAGGLRKTGAGTLSISTLSPFPGTVRAEGGTLAIRSGSALGSSTAGNGTQIDSGATLEVDGGIATAEPIRLNGTGDDGRGALFNGSADNIVQDVTLASDSSIGVAPDTVMSIPTSVAEVGGPARLTKMGGGVLDISGTTSHTGGTRVVAGTLVASGTVAGRISVAPGATLAGAGGALGDVTTDGGRLTAGRGSLPFTSTARSLTLDPTASFSAQLGGTTAGDGTTGHSRLVVDGDVALDGATLQTSLLDGYLPEPGDVLTILTSSDGVAGTFKDLPEGAVFGAGGSGGTDTTFRISYAGGDGNDVTLTAVTASTTSLSVSPNPSTTTDDVTLNATVTPSTATGTVTFKDGDTALATVEVAGGAATYTTGSLPEGTRTLTATYNGDTRTAPSTSSAVDQVVVNEPPSTSITSGPADGATAGGTSATFEFTSAAADVASYECSLDDAPFAACTSPTTYTALAGGAHTFAVRAKDAGGAVDPSPERRAWTVAGAFAITGRVTVTGSPTVGQTLKATSDVVAVPAATSVTGQWFRGSTPVAGQTRTTYTLTDADVSARMSYRESHARADYGTAEVSSEQTAAVNGRAVVGLPAAKLRLSAGSRAKVGGELTVVVKGLAAGETYTVRIGSKKVAAGSASAVGTARRSVRVPASTKPGKRQLRVTGSRADRAASRTVRITRTAFISLGGAKVRASDDQHVTVRGLRASERVTVAVEGKRVSPKNARAGADGVYRLTFDVGTAWGRRTVTVKGDKGSRPTSRSFTVVDRCPGSTYVCR